MLGEGWRDQYERMLRSRERLKGDYHTTVDYDDALYHALQDAWHLRDWLCNDHSIPANDRNALSNFTKGSTPLQIVSDLANCTKHLVRDRKSSPESAAFISRGAARSIAGGNLESRDYDAELKNGKRVSIVSTLDDAIAAWQGELKRCGLLM